MSGIAWNEDWTQYFGTFTEEQMTEDALHNWVRQYANSQMTDFVMNPNGQRTSYRSKVRDFLADGYDPSLPDDAPFFTSQKERIWTSLWERPIVHNLWLLEQRGLNPFAIWTDECWKIGLNPWFSMRMNDIHGVVDPTYFFHNNFWKSHPEYRCGEYRFAEGKSWYDAALNYAIPEVREYQYALIEEYITMYDLAGLELDLMRWPSFFKPGFQEQGIPIMNEFIHHVHEMLQKKPHGHEIKLGVRVPNSPETCYGCGLDPITWIREGWIDRIVPMQRYDGYYSGTPYEIWKRFTEGTDVELYGGLDIGVMAEPEVYYGFTSLETTRAFCSSMFYKGVQGVYLFNYIPTYSGISNWRELIEEVGKAETIFHKARRHMVCWNDFVAPGEPRSCMLPAELYPNIVKDFRLHLGYACGDEAKIFIAPKNPTDKPPKVRLNGATCTCFGKTDRPSPCPSKENRRSFYNGTPSQLIYKEDDEIVIWGYDVPKNAAHDGYNMVEVTAEEEQTITWVEVQLG